MTGPFRSTRFASIPCNPRHDSPGSDTSGARLVRSLARGLAALMLAGLVAAAVHAQPTPPPAADAAPPPPGPLGAAVPQHDLLGDWVLTWLGTGQTNLVRITGINIQPEYTDFNGQMAAGNDSCTFNASILNQATVVVPRPGPPAQPPAQVGLPAYVGLRIECPAASIFVHGLGSPSRTAAIVGRAEVTVRATGVRQLEPVLLGRPR
jgi:hypothetical protein